MDRCFYKVECWSCWNAGINVIFINTVYPIYVCFTVSVWGLYYNTAAWFNKHQNIRFRLRPDFKLWYITLVDRPYPSKNTVGWWHYTVVPDTPYHRLADIWLFRTASLFYSVHGQLWCHVRIWNRRLKKKLLWNTRIAKIIRRLIDVSLFE